MPIESFCGAVLKWPDDKAEDKGRQSLGESLAYTNRYEVASSRTSRAQPQESVNPAPP